MVTLFLSVGRLEDVWLGLDTEILGYDPHLYDSLIGMDVFHICYGPLIQDWALQITVRRYVPVFELYRQPGSWPESPFVPQTIWGWVTSHDKARGTWVWRDDIQLSSEMHIRMAVDACDPIVDIYAKWCASTQDDYTPALPNSRGRNLMDALETRPPQRSRSEPVPVRYYARLDNVRERFEWLTRRRYRPCLQAYMLRRLDDEIAVVQAFSTTPSPLLNFHLAWERHLRRLSITTHGLRKAKSPSQRERHFVL